MQTINGHALPALRPLLAGANVKTALIAHWGVADNEPPQNLNDLKASLILPANNTPAATVNAISAALGNGHGALNLDAAFQTDVVLQVANTEDQLRGQARYLGFMEANRAAIDSLPALRSLLEGQNVKTALIAHWGVVGNEPPQNLDALKTELINITNDSNITTRNAITTALRNGHGVLNLGPAFDGDARLQNPDNAKPLRRETRYLQFLEDNQTIFDALPELRRAFTSPAVKANLEAHWETPARGIPAEPLDADNISDAFIGDANDPDAMRDNIVTRIGRAIGTPTPHGLLPILLDENNLNTNTLLGQAHLHRINAIIPGNTPLRTMLTSPEHKEAVSRAIGGKTRQQLTDDIAAAASTITPTQTRTALNALGIDLANRPADIATITTQNKATALQKAETVRYDYDNTDTKRETNHLYKMFEQFKQRLKHFQHVTRVGVGSTTDSETIEKIEVTTHDIKIKLAKYRKLLQDELYPDDDAPRIRAIDDSKRAKLEGQIREIDALLLTAPDPNQGGGVIQKIEANITKIRTRAANRDHAYFSSAREAAQVPNMPGASSEQKYAAAQTAADHYLGNANAAAAPNLNLVVTAGGEELHFTGDYDVRLVPMLVTIDANRQQTSKVAMIQRKDATGTEGNIQIDDPQKFKQVQRLGFFSSIPGLAYFELASQVVRSIQASMVNKDDTLRIEPGTLSVPLDFAEKFTEQFTEAFMIYCKFKGLTAAVPGFRETISDSQIERFSKAWAAADRHAEDKGIREERALEEKTTLKLRR